MSSLSSDLLAILDSSDLASDSKAKLQERILGNADTLNAISQEAGVGSPVQRAALAGKASQIIPGAAVINTQDGTYTATLQRNWSTTCWLPAACIIKPKNTTEVQIILKIVTSLQARFAVRSSGHNPNAGFSSIGEDGVLLDLSGLNDITLSPRKDVVSVGPGTTWGEVYQNIEKHHHTVVGGRVTDVGVGGLILGGGMSHFSNRWGMACDNVKNFEVVLANSEVVNANATENPNLFRALKGGGSNFGIVTRFDLYSYPDYQVWYTLKIYSPKDAESVMKAAIKVQKAMESDDKIGFFLTVSSGFFVAGMIYLGSQDSKPPAFEAFDGITPINVAVPETNGTALSVAKACNIPHKVKREVGTMAILVDIDLYMELYNVLQGISESNPDSPSYSLVFTFQPVAPVSVTKGNERGGNSLNVAPVSQAWLAIAVEWTDDAHDELARHQIRQLISSIDAAARARSLHLNFKFMNDSSYAQSPLRSYGAKTLDFLNATRQQWDRESVFQRLQNRGFLLSKA